MALLIDYLEDGAELLAQRECMYTFDGDRDFEALTALFHAHEYHELIICRSPSVIVVCGDRLRRLGGDLAIFYPAGKQHLQLNDPHSVYRRLLVQYPPDYLEGIPGTADPKDFFFVPLGEKDLETLNPCVELLRRSDFEKDDPWKENEQRLLVALMQNTLARRISELAEKESEAVSREEDRKRRLYEVCRYIHAHYREKLTADSLARSQFISRATLNRLFHSVMEISLSEYVSRVRCGYAIRFMEEGRSVRETADLCGFADASHFIRVFRKICGVTPRRYGSGSVPLTDARS